MQAEDEATPEWPSYDYLYHHFLAHGGDLSVRTVDEYDASARATLRAGRRFTYIDRRSGEPRVGYYQPSPRRFTALTEDMQTILTHFRPEDPDYPRKLLRSTYTRR